jgi:hypothetical protein
MRLLDDALEELTRLFRAKTGLSGLLVALAALVAVSLVFTIIFLCVAAYLWLSLRYDSLTAALTLGCSFLFLTLAFAVACVVQRRRTMARARAAAPRTWWADPKLMAIGLEIGRRIGWRRLVPLAVVSVLAAGLTRSRPGD